MSYIHFSSPLNILIFLLSLNLIYSVPKVSTSINVEAILGTQKCLEGKTDNEKNTIYELINNSTENTVFIQYTSAKKFVISESFTDDSSILHKESKESSSYYLNMNSAKNNYYIILENDSNPHKICFYSFPEKGNIFTPDEDNSNIKVSSYELLTSSKLIYYIDNKDFSQNKIFYAMRFEDKYLDKIKKPKIEIKINYKESERKSENIEMNAWYLQNNYFYAIFYVPKMNYKEKFSEIFLCLDIEFSKTVPNDELFSFDLELVKSEEITNEYNLNITSNKNESIISPKVYFINIKKNIFEFDRDILFLKNDINNIYINSFFTSNYNISNENSVIIDKQFIDISASLFKLKKYSTLPKIDLFILILDEECNNIDEDENIFISFKFYGGYHSMVH